MVKNTSKLYKKPYFPFIVKEDTLKFKKGDILKSFLNLPIKLCLGSNVLTGNYYINWTGPYMDSQRRLDNIERIYDTN